VLSILQELAIEEWVAEDAFIPDLSHVSVTQLYRAMDFLLKANEVIQENVFFSVANLFNLEVDLLYFDTTSTYFETEEEDDLRKNGHSKDHRPDLPQAVIGLAVTRDGIPVRCWVWPGNTGDMSVIEEVKKDLERVEFCGDIKATLSGKPVDFSMFEQGAIINSQTLPGWRQSNCPGSGM
jgi:transposase